MLRRLPILLLLPLLLAACGGGGGRVYAPMEEVVSRTYVHAGPPTLTLYTVIANGSDAGAHTGLMVSGSQRAIWDPAGSFEHQLTPERGDVLFGITPQMLDVYIDYHARKRYRVVEQVLPVPSETAEAALRLMQDAGPQGSATCSLSTSRILSQLPGFEGFPVSYFPKKTHAAFARYGASERVIFDDDGDDRASVLAIPGYRPNGEEEPESQAVDETVVVQPAPLAEAEISG